MKIINKRVLQNVAINHSADIGFQDFIKIYGEYAREPYNFLTLDSTLPYQPVILLKKYFKKNYLILTYKNYNNWSD